MKVKGDEYFCRINYLYQAAETVGDAYPCLGKHYGKILRTIAEKTPAKLDFTLKRSLCKGCNVTLSTGSSFTYRLRRRKGRKNRPTQIITCKGCKTVKKFPTVDNYRLRAERDGTIL